jgi:hypothetical protein
MESLGGGVRQNQFAGVRPLCGWAGFRVEQFQVAREEFRRLGFGPRIINALIVRKIYTVRDLERVSEDDLAQLPGIGPGALQTVRPYLRKTNRVLDDKRAALAVKFDMKLLREIDTWAVKQTGVVSRAEAVRRLVEMALTRKS